MRPFFVVLDLPPVSCFPNFGEIVVGWLARELGCCMLSDVGRLFKRDVGSISSAVRRLSERMQKDSELAERMAFLKTELESYT